MDMCMVTSICSIIILVHAQSVNLVSGTCSVSKEHMVCTETIPEKVPSNITDVEIGNITWSFNAKNLSDPTWSKITRLVLAETLQHVPNLNKIFGRTFEKLLKVEYLKLSFHTVAYMDTDAFVGLPSLRYLVLSNCWRLSLNHVLDVFTDSRSFPNIMSLRIDSLNLYNHDVGFYLNETFYKTIALRNVSELILHTPIFILEMPSVSAPTTLGKLDISHSSVNQTGNIWKPFCKSVRYLDISSVTANSPFKGFKLSDKTVNLTSFLFKIVFNEIRLLKSLKMNNLLTILPTIVQNLTVILPKVNLSLEYLSIQGNMLHYLDLYMVVSPGFLEDLKTLQIQNNELEFINPDFFKHENNLQVINASNNCFYKMHRNNPEKFSRLVEHLENLTVLDLSHNNLNSIPIYMFGQNKHLKELYLGNNILKQFYLRTSINLTVLDLSGNNIRYLSSQSMTWLQAVFDLSYDGSFKVNLMGNPLQCSCEAIPFLKWFISSRMFHFRGSFYSCERKGSQKPLTSKTVKDLISDCTRMQRLRLYLLSTIVPIVTLVLIGTSMFFICRNIRTKQKRKQALYENINQFREGTHKYKYPVFLSYSSADGDFVLDKVYGPLLEGLRVCIGTEANLLCVGELHFKPGYTIHEEVIRCLEMSGVFLAFISEDYCASPYCRTEFERAYSMEKPILQVYKDNVNDDLMWPFLRKTYKQYTRIQVRKTNNEVEFRPDIETICTAILELI